MEGTTWDRLEAYDRSSHALRLAFHWTGYGDREAWFTHWDEARVDRKCSACEMALAPTEPAWVSGGTGYVLCEACANEAELLQGGTFREEFIPDP